MPRKRKITVGKKTTPFLSYLLMIEDMAVSHLPLDGRHAFPKSLSVGRRLACCRRCLNQVLLRRGQGLDGGIDVKNRGKPTLEWVQRGDLVQARCRAHGERVATRTSNQEELHSKKEHLEAETSNQEELHSTKEEYFEAGSSSTEKQRGTRRPQCRSGGGFVSFRVFV